MRRVRELKKLRTELRLLEASDIRGNLTLVAASCLIPCGRCGCPCGSRSDLANRAQGTLKAPTFDPNDNVDRSKCGLQIFHSSFVLAFDLIEVSLEVSLCIANLLGEQIGARMSRIYDP
jgi:hypothetical protein